MSLDAGDLLDQISPHRMRELLLDFANIPSPPHRTAVAAEWYAGCLRASGAAEVCIMRDWLHAPTVVAGFPGLRRAPILEINGHLDAVQIGPAQAGWDGATIVGRGIVSGKAELIAAAEAARVLASAGPLPGGGLLIVAHSRHEPPDGDGQDLATHIERGVVGDAVVIAGGGSRVIPVAGLGLGIFRAVFSPLSAPMHERHRLLNDSSGGGTLGYTAIDAAQAFAVMLRRRAARLARECDPLIGAESLFVSRIEGGDRYDRLPASCCVEGNWRWMPERHAGEVFRELEAMAQLAAHRRSARVDLTLAPCREGFRIDPQSPIVGALRLAHATVSGQPIPLGASMYASDAAIFRRTAGVDAVCHGVDTTSLRTDRESVTLDELVRVARTYLCLAVSYLTAHGGDRLPARQERHRSSPALSVWTTQEEPVRARSDR